MKKKFEFILVLIIILSLFILTGCGADNSAEMINNKIDSEMSYLENVIFMIVKKYMANDYLADDGTLEWISIKNDFSDLNNSANVLINDFVSKDFSSEDILKYEEFLNAVNIAISEENEVNILLNLANLYSIIPEYRERYLGYNSEVTIRKIKLLNLYSIISCIQGDFAVADDICSQTESEYINLTKDTEYIKENGYYINRIYVVLQEYKNSLKEENLELSIIKYLNTLGI